MAMPLPRPRRWSCAFVAILIPFYIKSTVELVYLKLNVNFQRYEIFVAVAMLQVVNMNHRLIILNDKVQARRRRSG